MAARAISSTEELIDRARAIVPLIASRIEETHALRDIPSECGAAMRVAGLFRLYQPAEWGGYECDPETFMAVQGIIAEACLSHAWVQGVLAVQPLVLALFDRAAQADLWAKDPFAVVSSAFQPTGTATVVEGGYRLSGRWLFSSGCSLADWVTVGRDRSGGGRRRRGRPAADAGAEAMVRIDDIWHSFGLRGTGSNDLLIEDAFVPTHRTYVPDMGIVNFPRAERPRSALYRLPWLPIFALATCNLAVGAGRAALRSFLATARTRVGGLSGKAVRDDPAVQELCARLAAEIDLIDLGNRAMVAGMMRHVQADTIIPMDEALRYRTRATTALRTVTATVEEMTLVAGARGVMEHLPLTRIWLDLCAARLHPGNDPHGPARMLGTLLMEQAPA